MRSMYTQCIVMLNKHRQKLYYPILLCLIIVVDNIVIA